MRAAPLVLDRAKYAIPQPAEIEEAIFVPEFEVATTNSKLEPGMRESYYLLPFRALLFLPAAIQQRWEASVAASWSAEWRLWFKTLQPAQQKARILSLCKSQSDQQKTRVLNLSKSTKSTKSTKDRFWARFLLGYEERAQPQPARFIGAAARAWAILEPERVREKMKEARRSAAAYDEPLSAPPTPNDIDSLKLRLAPCYSRLPTSAFRFATQIFSGKSYEEAMAEKEVNFDSWVKESKASRIDGQPDLIVWGNVAVHKDAFPKFTPKKEKEKKKKPQTEKQGTKASNQDQGERSVARSNDVRGS